MALSPGDPHSYARPDSAVITHSDLELYVDFHRSFLWGKAILTIKKHHICNEIILDTYRLTIFSVTEFYTRSRLEYDIGNCDIFGNKFTIKLPRLFCNDKWITIQIEYRTSQNSPALYWLKPDQTSDGTHPFLISDSKLTYARAIFPCQDTPSVKAAYSTQISVPLGFKVIMSGNLQRVSKISGRLIYEYCQNIPIASYAVVIVVGSLECAKIGRRINLWAEKTHIQQSTNAFAEIERVVVTAENLCGPYLWGTYNICVLPPSVHKEFEVESVCVTFVSSTLLGNDYFLVNTIARSIPQSWTGNLVTCATFKHLWLTKSFSTFIYRKIIAVIFGKKAKLLLEVAGYNNVRSMVERSNNIKSLLPRMMGFLPKNVVKTVSYEKGTLLLNYLQRSLGGPEVFEEFLKAYINKFKCESIKTNTWKEYLYNYFSEKEEVLNSLDWHSWLTKPPCTLKIDLTIYFDNVEQWRIAETSKILVPQNISTFNIELYIYNFRQEIDILEILHLSEFTPTVFSLLKLPAYPFDQQNCKVSFCTNGQVCVTRQLHGFCMNKWKLHPWSRRGHYPDICMQVLRVLDMV